MDCAMGGFLFCRLCPDSRVRDGNRRLAFDVDGKAFHSGIECRPREAMPAAGRQEQVRRCRMGLQSILRGKPDMPEMPTFGRYAEIPYDELTPEQQEGYRFLVETRGAAGGPSKIWVHNPKLVKASAPLGAHFHPGGYSLSEREREI